jgi:hypothetical protein
MKSHLIVLVASAIVLSIFCSISNAGWPANTTPAIEGRVVDATTGKPIENVVVSAGWTKRVPAFVDTVTRGITSEVVITDKDGRYRIPQKTTWHFFSTFYAMSISFVQPIYETKRYGVMELQQYNLRPEDKKYDGKFGIQYSTSPLPFQYQLAVEQNGVIRFNVPLMSLEEKYIHQVEQMKTVEEKKKAAWNYWSFLDGQDTAYYWKCLDKSKISYDLQVVFDKWRLICAYLKPYVDSTMTLEETESKIHKQLAR